MLARLMNLDELTCVGKSMESVPGYAVYLQRKSVDRIPQLG